MIRYEISFLFYVKREIVFQLINQRCLHNSRWICSKDESYIQ